MHKVLKSMNAFGVIGLDGHSIADYGRFSDAEADAQREARQRGEPVDIVDDHGCRWMVTTVVTQLLNCPAIDRGLECDCADLSDANA